MACRTSTTNRRQRRGFSIAEALIASTILAIAVVGIAGPLGAASQQAKVVRERATALVLARQLMEEITAKPLWDGGTTCRPGPESGELGRANFDSADDYHNYNDRTDDLKNLSGSRLAFENNALFRRAVTVEYRATPAGAAAAT